MSTTSSATTANMKPKPRRLTQKDIDAIRNAVIAIDDWIVTHASDFCSKAMVKEAQARIDAHGGTLAYATEVRQALEKIIS